MRWRPCSKSVPIPGSPTSRSATSSSSSAARSSRFAWRRRHYGDGPHKVTAEAERRRPGRPAGASDTRERIRISARELFAQNGIDKTSIRAIAAAAGVDPALVHHYYGTKQQLFAAAIHVPIDPMEVLGPLRDTP